MKRIKQKIIITYLRLFDFTWTDAMDKILVGLNDEGR